MLSAAAPKKWARPLQFPGHKAATGSHYAIGMDRFFFEWKSGIHTSLLRLTHASWFTKPWYPVSVDFGLDGRVVRIRRGREFVLQPTTP
jgi:hypothetical protein